MKLRIFMLIIACQQSLCALPIIPLALFTHEGFLTPHAIEYIRLYKKSCAALAKIPDHQAWFMTKSVIYNEPTHRPFDIYSVSDGTLIDQLDITFTEYLSAVDPSATLLAAAFNGELQMWDLITGALVFQLVFDSPIFTMNFDNTGTLLATVDFQNIIRILDTTTGTTLQILLPDQPIILLQFNATATQLATATNNGLVLIWDLSTAAIIQQIQLQTPIFDMQFNNGDTQIVIGSYTSLI